MWWWLVCQYQLYKKSNNVHFLQQFLTSLLSLVQKSSWKPIKVPITNKTPITLKQKKVKKYSIINNSIQHSLLKKLSFFLYILKPLQTCVNCNTLQGYTLAFWMEESDLIIQEFLKAFLVLALCCCYICLRKTLIGLCLQTYNFKKS